MMVVFKEFLHVLVFLAQAVEEASHKEKHLHVVQFYVV
jgi:hypothetical protein